MLLGDGRIETERNLYLEASELVGVLVEHVAVVADFVEGVDLSDVAVLILALIQSVYFAASLFQVLLSVLNHF